MVSRCTFPEVVCALRLILLRLGYFPPSLQLLGSNKSSNELICLFEPVQLLFWVQILQLS